MVFVLVCTVLFYILGGVFDDLFLDLCSLFFSYLGDLFLTKKTSGWKERIALKAEEKKNYSTSRTTHTHTPSHVRVNVSLVPSSQSLSFTRKCL